MVSSTLIIASQNARAQKPDSARARQLQEVWQGDSLRRGRLLQRLGPELARMGRVFWDIPEYHDEQRFVDGSKFGPIVNIFASPTIDGFTETWQIEEQGIPGLLVAVVVVDTTAGATLPPSYTNLSLVAGINCLWLSFEPGVPGGPWKGRISEATAGGECDRGQPMHDLDVARQRHPSHPNHGDYPPVGRFTETTTGQPLLGTQCLVAWCEFGPTGFTPLPPNAGSTGREDRIKGWHDEQRLAEGSGSTMTVGPRAVVVPVPNVNKHSDKDFNSNWVPVARIRFVDPLPATSKYYKAGFRQGWNRFELQKTSTGAWQARVIPSGGTPQLVPNVVPHPHYGAAVPGTARWRYTSADEGVWVPCGQKCCRAEF